MDLEQGYHLYKFEQNNSGGYWNIDDKVSVAVFIVAKSASEANSKAEQVGIYFNGVEDEIDCPCCGDRWYSVWRDEKYDWYEDKFDKELSDSCLWGWGDYFIVYDKDLVPTYYYKDGSISSKLKKD